MLSRCDIKGSDGTVWNPIFWKKVQWQKQPGRRGIVEHQIPSIKVLFKTNAKSYKHPGIKLLSSESKTQLVNNGLRPLTYPVQHMRNELQAMVSLKSLFNARTTLAHGNGAHQRRNKSQHALKPTTAKKTPNDNCKLSETDYCKMNLKPFSRASPVYPTGQIY